MRALPFVVRAFSEVRGSENWMREVRAPDPDQLDVTDWGRAVLTVVQAAIAQNRGEFDELGRLARSLGFADVASGPFVRSSYHADEMART